MAKDRKEETEVSKEPVRQPVKQKEEGITVEGLVLSATKNGFQVEIWPLDSVREPDPKKKKVIQAHLAGKLRKFFIKIVAGDQVQVVLSPYDLTKGRIIFRKK